MIEKKQFWEYTKYPKLFKNVYWGKFESDSPNWDIIRNRNMFVELFKIQSYKNIKARWKLHESVKWFDHSELYLTKNNTYLFLTSPYYFNFHDLQFLHELNFYKWCDLYYKTAFSILCEFRSLSDIGDAVKSIDKYFKDKEK